MCDGELVVKQELPCTGIAGGQCPADLPPSTRVPAAGPTQPSKSSSHTLLLQHPKIWKVTPQRRLVCKEARITCHWNNAFGATAGGLADGRQGGRRQKPPIPYEMSASLVIEFGSTFRRKTWPIALHYSSTHPLLSMTALLLTVQSDIPNGIVSLVLRRFSTPSPQPF